MSFAKTNQKNAAGRHVQVESKQDSSLSPMESGTEILVDLGDKGSTKILCLNYQTTKPAGTQILLIRPRT